MREIPTFFDGTLSRVHFDFNSWRHLLIRCKLYHRQTSVAYASTDRRGRVSELAGIVRKSKRTFLVLKGPAIVRFEEDEEVLP